ncbi:secretory phospholipase [Corynascus novoguineensis]|uniref:Secretory phospholipase n=1 Tax=Corynascus novoguineensis TaxID=1126955 RepID=A0AAN7CKP9_9PEZI|nr:secretory phospholipase [Corynascus novoguineensis]
MKFLASVLVLASSVLALPDPSKASTSLAQRASDAQITDQYLFDITLPAFTTKRNAKDPASLDWTSDGCSKSPDNPFGFPFVPACHRHDFGYRNYKKQNRFTDDGKLSIDNNFKDDAKGACEALAEVYYSAVRAFGRSKQGKRDDDLIKEYEEKVALYNQAVAEAQAKGELWVIS